MPQSKKSIVPLSAETRDVVVHPFAKATGAQDPKVSIHLVYQAVSAMNNPIGQTKEKRAEQNQTALTLLQQINPQNELEGLLAVQMFGVHEASMECLRQTVPNAGMPDARDSNLKHAVKLMGLFTRQLEALDRLRGKGQQKMTVERVNVESGGQAIVGQIDASRNWPTRDLDSKSAAAEEAPDHGPSDAVNSGSSNKAKKK
jgi:hypothetical protein